MDQSDKSFICAREGPKHVYLILTSTSFFLASSTFGSITFRTPLSKPSMDWINSGRMHRGIPGYTGLPRMSPYPFWENKKAGTYYLWAIIRNTLKRIWKVIHLQMGMKSSWNYRMQLSGFLKNKDLYLIWNILMNWSTKRFLKFWKLFCKNSLNT